MLNEKQAQAIVDALLSCNAARECDVRFGFFNALKDPMFSEWRMNYGKLYINCGRIWYGSSGNSWKEARLIEREANRLLAEVVAREGINLQVPAAYYRNTAPLTAEMAEEAWQAIGLSTRLDDKRKDKFLRALATRTDETVYVPTRNRQEGLNFLNCSFGFHLQVGSDWQRRSYSSASEALRQLFARHCALHNL